MLKRLLLFSKLRKINIFDRAFNCYGVKIERGQNGWDAQSEQVVEKLYDEDYYKENDCDDKSEKWLRIRFFILDTGVVTAWACLQDDAEACTDLGLQTESTSLDSEGSLSEGVTVLQTSMTKLTWMATLITKCLNRKTVNGHSIQEQSTHKDTVIKI